MKIEKVTAVYFSAVGNTKNAVEKLAAGMAAALKVPTSSFDFTLPEHRTEEQRFEADELVIFGTPTYAGRVPNKVLPFVQTLFRGEQTPAVAVVTFGNRSFDSALTELRDELEKDGFRVFAAAAVACGHVFSDAIAPGRPDAEDMERLKGFSAAALEKLTHTEEAGRLTRPVIRGDAPVGAYYTPLGTDGQPAKFLKATPKTDEARCDRCGICVKVCPMGSIDAEDMMTVRGICIKCQACIRKCPQRAKYFDDPAFRSHVAMLEQNYTRRAEPAYYI